MLIITKKMNWKEFFRPDKTKLVTTLLLGIIFILIYFIIMLPGSSCGTMNAMDNKLCIIIGGILFGLPLLFEVLFGFTTIFPNNSILQLIIFFFIEVVYLYILAIVIVAVYNKIKKKKKL